jgi:hypothetical protein
MTRSRYLLWIACWWAAYMVVDVQCARGDSRCVVTQQHSFWTQSARFDFGLSQARITLPNSMAAPGLIDVFLEVAGDDMAAVAELTLVAGAQTVQVAPGVRLRIDVKPHERLVFQVFAKPGRELCEWRPSFLAWRSRPVTIPSGPGHLNEVESWDFRNTGEPIMLRVRGSELGPYMIDGQIAAVLARSPFWVILRDPNPSAGERTVAAGSESVRLRFVDVEVSFGKGAATQHANLIVRIRGVLFRGRRLWPLGHVQGASFPWLIMSNFRRDVVELRCGRPVSDARDKDSEEMVSMDVRGGAVHGNIITVTCAVRIRGAGKPEVGVLLHEDPPRH